MANQNPVEHQTLPKLPGEEDGPCVLFLEGFSTTDFMADNLLGLPSQIPGVPFHEETKEAWRGTKILRISCFEEDEGDISDVAIEKCRYEIASGSYHAVVVVDLSHFYERFESGLARVLQSFVRSGGTVAFPTSEGLHLAGTLGRMFDTEWKPSSYYRTRWSPVVENPDHVRSTFGEGLSSGPFSAKACSLRDVPPNERCFGVGDTSRTQSMVPMFAGRDVSKPKEPDSVTADYAALQGDYDVCVATHRYGEGVIAYFGDVNCEGSTAELVAAFLRNTAGDEPVPAWSLESTIDPGKFQNAMAAKEAGNDAFGRSSDEAFTEAVQHYEEALACYEDKDGSPGKQRQEKINILSNKAECHLRLDQWDQAEFTATQALSLDRHHFKSLLRRAKACIGACRVGDMDHGKLTIAQADLLVLVRANVNPKTTKKMLSEVNEILKALDDYDDDDYDDVCDDYHYNGGYHNDDDDDYDDYDDYDGYGDLIEQGVMPWDDDAGDVIAALHSLNH